MNRSRKSRTIGRDPSCELVLDHATVSRLHARLELAEDGLIHVLDESSRNGTFLQRNNSWIRAEKVTLCIGDRIRFGEMEVSLERLTGVFGHASGARLEAKHFPPRNGSKFAGASVDHQARGPELRKPRRNPLTGKIEEQDVQ